MRFSCKLLVASRFHTLFASTPASSAGLQTLITPNRLLTAAEISFPSTARKRRLGCSGRLGAFLVIFALAALYAFTAATVSSAQDYNYPESTSVDGGGTLKFTLQEQMGYCGSEYQDVDDTYENFVYTPASGGAGTSLNGSLVYIYGCDASWGSVPSGWGEPGGTDSELDMSYGQCTLDFDGNSWSASMNCPPSYQGFINPKYVVIGVDYAPPGSSSSVSYASNTVVGSSTSTSKSFSNKTTTTVSLSSKAGIPGFLSGAESTTISQSYQQQSGSSSSVSVSQTTSYKTSLNGFTDPETGVNHNFDYILVWLNPIAMYTITQNLGVTTVASNGYGYDMTDTHVYNDMDVIGIPVGCITGWLQQNYPTTWGGQKGTCADIASVYARTWAQNNVDGSGPGLTSADLQSILEADPFYENYTPTLAPDSYTTTDGRFTECYQNCQQVIDFEPGVSTNYSEGYSSSSTNTQNYSHSETFAVTQKISTSAFWKTFTASLQVENEMTWQYSSSNSVNQSNGQTASFNIVGPPPGYDGPLQFVAFQDNYFGTFMFYQ